MAHPGWMNSSSRISVSEPRRKRRRAVASRDRVRELLVLERLRCGRDERVLDDRLAAVHGLDGLGGQGEGRFDREIGAIALDDRLEGFVGGLPNREGGALERGPARIHLKELHPQVVHACQEDRGPERAHRVHGELVQVFGQIPGQRPDVDRLVVHEPVSVGRSAHRGFRERPRLVKRELLAEPLLEDPVRDWRTAARGHEVLRRDRPAHVARVHVGAFAVHPGDDELHVERVVALHRRIHDVRDQLRALFHGQRIAATQREEPTFGLREVHEVFRVRHCPGDRHRGCAVEGENLLDHVGSDEEPLRGALVRREDDAVLASYSDRCGHVEPQGIMSAVGYVVWNIETSVTTCSRKRGAALSLRSTATYPTLLRLLTNASRIKATPATSTRRGRIMGTGGTGWQGPVAMHPANTRSRIAAKPPRRPKPTPVRSSLEPRTDSAMTRDMIRSKGKPCRPYRPYNSPTGSAETGDALVAGGVVDGNGYRRVTISRDFRRLISR